LAAAGHRCPRALVRSCTRARTHPWAAHVGLSAWPPRVFGRLTVDHGGRPGSRQVHPRMSATCRAVTFSLCCCRSSGLGPVSAGEGGKRGEDSCAPLLIWSSAPALGFSGGHARGQSGSYWVFNGSGGVQAVPIRNKTFLKRSSLLNCSRLQVLILQQRSDLLQRVTTMDDQWTRTAADYRS